MSTITKTTVTTTEKIKDGKVTKGKKSERKKGKKGSSKKGKGKGKQVINPFLQKQEPSKASFGTGAFGGAGGLGMGVGAGNAGGAFQRLGGSTGFSVPIQQPFIYTQQTEPKLQEIVTKPKERYYSPQEAVESEEKIYKELEKSTKKLSKEEFKSKIYNFFGGDSAVDMDYINQDYFLEFNTKKRILEVIASYVVDGRLGPDFLKEFINYNPPPYEADGIVSIDESKDDGLVAETVSQVGGEMLGRIQ
jgi:hypothetical protein